VVERGSEYILAHTGPRELDGHPLGGCGSGFGLIPGYTTLSVRVRTNIYFGALKIKSVRTNENQNKRVFFDYMCMRSPFIPWFKSIASALEPGASALPGFLITTPYYCTSICVRSWYIWLASCVDSKPPPKKKQNWTETYSNLMNPRKKKRNIGGN